MLDKIPKREKTTLSCTNDHSQKQTNIKRSRVGEKWNKSGNDCNIMMQKAYREGMMTEAERKRRAAAKERVEA